MSGIRITGMFDMRAPAFGTPGKELYAAALDICAYADEIGVPRINLMEHHCSDDGYLPAPFVLGGGVAARTKTCRISLGAVQPQHGAAVGRLEPGGRLEELAAARQGHAANKTTRAHGLSQRRATSR